MNAFIAIFFSCILLMGVTNCQTESGHQYQRQASSSPSDEDRGIIVMENREETWSVDRERDLPLDAVLKTLKARLPEHGHLTYYESMAKTDSKSQIPAAITLLCRDRHCVLDLTIQCSGRLGGLPTFRVNFAKTVDFANPIVDRLE